jgi:hypothetical protein
MSKDKGEKSPYGAGFIGACIVVGAVLICGIVIIFAGGDRSTQASAAVQQPVDTVAPQPTNDPASTPDDGAAQTNSPRSPSRTGSCGLPAGDQAVPAEAPAVDGWEVSRRVVVPRSSTYGPGTTDSDGFRHCFAHSPTGAVYAAYSAIAAIADQDKLVPTVKKLMVPGPATDSLLRQAGDESSSGASTVQVVGYRVIDAGPDRVTLMLAMPVESVYMSANLTLVWHQGDWRLQPPTPGEAVGAPFSQHRDLSDFVKWSGI